MIGLNNFRNDSRYGLRSLYNGTFKETFNALATSDGATVTMTLTNAEDASKPLTMQFSDGDTRLAAGSTIELTAGSDTSPQANYIYIPQSTKVLTKSTSSFPDGTEHIKVSYFFVPSASRVQSEGCYINQNWNDHLTETSNMGHLPVMGERSRRDGAYYFSGIDPNGTDQDTNSSYFDWDSGSTAYFKSTAGVIYQMHRHTVPAVDTSQAGVDMHVVNWNGNNYNHISSFGDIVADSQGVTLSNKYFNLFFFAVGNKTGEYAPMMCQLPSGSYTTQVSAENDVDGYDNLTMPRQFALDSSTGVPICRMTLRYTGGTTTLSHISTTDLRSGGITAGGGATGATTNFADNQFTVFDADDITRILAFDAGSITTGNTRTLTIPDVDTNMWADNGSVPLTGNWDAGSFTIESNGFLVNVNAGADVFMIKDSFGYETGVSMAGTLYQSLALEVRDVDYITVSESNPGLGFNAVQLEVATLAKDKIAFTQTDGNEYIDSLNDGYMDYGATTAHRFNIDVTSDTDNTDSLGTSSIGWKDLQLRNQAFIGGVTSTTQTVNLGTSLTSHYSMDDNAANTTVTDGQAANNGTLQGGNNTQDISVAGKLNLALDLDGTNDYIDWIDGTFDSVFESGSYSFAFWGYRDGDSGSSYDAIFSHTAGGSDNRFAVNTADNSIAARKEVGNLTVTTPANAFPTGEWKHIVFSYDSGTGDITIYVNAVNTADGSFSNFAANAAAYELGDVTASGSNRNWNGKMDDVRIYNKALSQAEVTGLYNSGTGTTSTGEVSVGATHQAIATTATYTSSHGLNALADLAIEGELEVNGASFFDDDMKIQADSKKFYLGAADDGYVEHDGDSLNIVANSTTNTDDLNFTADDFNFYSYAGNEMNLYFYGDDSTGRILYDDDRVNSDNDGRFTFYNDIATSSARGLFYHSPADPSSSDQAVYVSETPTFTSSNAQGIYALNFTCGTATDEDQDTGTFYGVQGFCYNRSAAGTTMNNMIGMKAGCSINNDGDTTSAYGIWIANQSSGATGALGGDIGTLYGIYIAPFVEDVDWTGSITTQYGLRVHDVDAGGTNWSIHTGLGDVSFGDDVHIRTDSDKLYFGAEDDGSATHTGSGLVIQSDETTATDHLQLRGGTNGIDFNIGATEEMTIGSNSISGRVIKDEDDMASDSATHLATQQSIKAYVDSVATGGDSFIGCYAYLTSDQSVNSASTTQITLDAESYDVGSDFNTGTYIYTVPETGYYLMVGQAHFLLMGDAKRCYVYIQRDPLGGGSYATVGLASANTSYANSYVTSNTSGVYYLTATDLVKMVVNHNHGSARNVAGGASKTFLSITKVG